MSTAALLLILGGAALANASAPPPPCTHLNKQIALYLDYTFTPSLAAAPATDISVDHVWNSTTDMRRFGKNGVYAAQPIGFADGPGGYFGSQADADPQNGGLLFSIWDKERRNGEQPGGYPCSKAPNATWCGHRHSFPLSANCKRHCLDCGLHPGWHNTTGTQCGLPMELTGGQAHLRFRLVRTANNSVLRNPLGMGLTYYGSEWTLTAINMTGSSEEEATTSTSTSTATYSSSSSSNEEGTVLGGSGSRSDPWVVGKMFFEDTTSGVTRFGAFHEHIGCTPCASFYESEIRVGPFNIKSADSPPGGGGGGTSRTVESISFTRKNVSCELYNVAINETGGIPSAQFFTGPGTGPK